MNLGVSKSQRSHGASDDGVTPAPRGDVVLRLTGLRKQYGDVTAVDGLDLTVRQGEIVGLLGPNGAGKTTTVNLILGLLTPTAGSVELFGENLVAARSRVLRRINFASAYAGGSALSLTISRGAGAWTWHFRSAIARRRFR